MGYHDAYAFFFFVLQGDHGSCAGSQHRGEYLYISFSRLCAHTMISHYSVHTGSSNYHASEMYITFSLGFLY